MHTINIVNLCLLALIIWWHGAGGHKSSLMKWMMDKGHHHDEGKTIGFHVKPIAIPIPLPVAMPVKGDVEKPWPSPSNDMFWKIMMMKMMTKGDKAKPAMCCPQKAKGGGGGWPMMMMKAKMMKAEMKAWKAMAAMKASKKAEPTMMCCPQTMMMMKGMKAMKGGMKAMKGGMKAMKGMSGCNMMMMNGGWPSPMMKGGCNMMMNGGWPAPSGDMMCCQTSGNGGGGWPAPSGDMMCCPSGNGGGGWPAEEEPEEEEEEPDWDYEEEDPPPAMMGWDTMNVPDFVLPPETSQVKSQIYKSEIVTVVRSKKGDSLDELRLSRDKRTTKIFRKGLKSRKAIS